MRVRKTDASGDYVFGRGFSDYWQNVPDGVGLAVLYRLQLRRGEWWLDTSLGVPWETQVVGKNTASTRDPVIRSTILATQGVSSIASYSSTLDREARHFSVSAEINTQYSTSPAAVQTTIGVAV